MRKIIFSLLLLCSAPLFAQESGKSRQFWLQAGAETAIYGQDTSGTFGGGFSAGYSILGSAFSTKAAWFGGSNGENVLEITLSVRFWLGSDLFSGGFYQFQAGALFFAPKTSELFGENGQISGSVSFAAFGYRFLLENRYYIEPVLRFGYPYLAGVSLSGGVHF